MSTYGYCMVCGEPGGHGNLQCPRLHDGPFRAPEYHPNPTPLPQGARPVDYVEKLDRIIDLLEQIRDNTMLR